MSNSSTGTAAASLRRLASLAVMLLAVVAFAAGAAWGQAARTTNASTDSRAAPQTMPGAHPQVEPGYRLGSGDRVRITVYGQPELTGEYSVDGSGSLAFPLIGQVQAGGLTAASLEQLLVSKLKPDYLKDPSVSVEVLTYRPFYIVGEVRTPGSYAYVSGMTVINAVALAGGFTYRAKENSFYVTRTGENGEKTKLSASPDTPVLPGDVITVRERYF
ncbi:MAG TPA: polysaccharide biosynthesis/export family protein [Ferrovibrio sp.]|uniref:polysaccharide biosynthesis/export family protein n=1 Tax=Ferrovibrio sp. TaxID=1917215 RepID=UPI002ED159BA